MTDRKAKVTRQTDGTYRVEGVAYVADEPNVNGRIYTKDVLEKALAEFLAKGFRPVTFGCKVRPKLADVIGEVVGGEVRGNEVHMEVKTLPSHWASRGMEGRQFDTALAGSGTGLMDVKTGRISDFHITSIGLVGAVEVDPGESSHDD